MAAATKYLLACYGKKYITCTSFTACRIKVWKQKAAGTSVKLCTLPPTTEASTENIKRAHFQVAHMRTALSGTPLSLSANEFGWCTDSSMRGNLLVPRAVPPHTKVAPDEVQEMI